MTETVPGDRVHAAVPTRSAPIISGRSLLLRLLICIVTIMTMSIGGAWLMHAAIDPAADMIDGAAAQELRAHDGAAPRLTSFGNGLRVIAPVPSPAAGQ